MGVHIAEIEGNCFYIILSTLLFWRRSDLFSVSLKNTGYVSLHNQTPLHMTLSKLAFTSHCICFYYIIIGPVSSAYAIVIVLFAWPRYIGCWLWTGHCSSYLFPGYMFPALFANQILICFMSAGHVSSVLSPLHLQYVGWLWTGHCSDFIASGTVVNLTLICSMSAAAKVHTSGFSCSIILVQWLLLWTSHRFNTFIFHLGTLYLYHFR